MKNNHPPVKFTNGIMGSKDGYFTMPHAWYYHRTPNTLLAKGYQSLKMRSCSVSTCDVQEQWDGKKWKPI